MTYSLIICTDICCTVVLISPSSPDGVYTVEVQREIEISCTAAFPSIVQWASKSKL